MKKTLSFRIQPDGKLFPGTREMLSRLFPMYADKLIRLTIEEAKEARSLSQNAYYWVAVIPAVRAYRLELGDPLSKEQIHEDLLAQFAPMVTGKRLDGTIYTRPMRSKEMSLSQMAAYLTAITGWMATEGYPILEIEHYGELHG